MGRPRIFTHEVLVSIPEMVESGMRADAIAKKLGTTPQSLYVACSQNGISLRRSCDRVKRRIALAGEENSGPAKDNFLVVALSLGVRLSLSREAQRREMAPEQLVRRLFTIIAQDDLYDAVLGAPRRKETCGAIKPCEIAGPVPVAAAARE